MATLSPLLQNNAFGNASFDAAALYRQASAQGAAQAASNRPEAPVEDSERRRLEQVAQEFEGLFIAQMLQPMFETIGSDPLFGGGSSEKAWKSLLIDEYGKQIAASGGLGLSSSVMAALLKTQETAS